MTGKNRIDLTWTSTSWECDLCGCIDDEKLIVQLNGKNVLELESDGHFGNGDDLYNPNSVINKILPAIGSTTVHMELDRGRDRDEVIKAALIGLGYDVYNHDEGYGDLD